MIGSVLWIGRRRIRGGLEAVNACRPKGRGEPALPIVTPGHDQREAGEETPDLVLKRGAEETGEETAIDGMGRVSVKRVQRELQPGRIADHLEARSRTRRAAQGADGGESEECISERPRPDDENPAPLVAEWRHARLASDEAGSIAPAGERARGNGLSLCSA